MHYVPHCIPLGEMTSKSHHEYRFFLCCVVSFAVLACSLKELQWVLTQQIIRSTQCYFFSASVSHPEHHQKHLSHVNMGLQRTSKQLFI